LSKVIKKKNFYIRVNTNFANAVELDEYYRYDIASEEYEKAILLDDIHVSPEMYMNLSFIYWRSGVAFDPSDSDIIFPTTL
jgi:hypothetical protein